jgi:hypothetical protein
MAYEYLSLIAALRTEKHIPEVILANLATHGSTKHPIALFDPKRLMVWRSRREVEFLIASAQRS